MKALKITLAIFGGILTLVAIFAMGVWTTIDWSVKADKHYS